MRIIICLNFYLSIALVQSCFFASDASFEIKNASSKHVYLFNPADIFDGLQVYFDEGLIPDYTKKLLQKDLNCMHTSIYEGQTQHFIHKDINWLELTGLPPPALLN